uniref:Uncharacterized protein n=1 Tax=Escherichia phage 1-6af TaxID=3117707 RepID=A0AAU6NU15_9CAUD
MNLVLDFLSELIPRFRTEKCAFIKESSDKYGDGEMMELTCIGRLVDLGDETDFDVTMDVSSLGWLFFRAFVSYKYETFKDYSKGGTDE